MKGPKKRHPLDRCGSTVGGKTVARRKWVEHGEKRNKGKGGGGEGVATGVGGGGTLKPIAMVRSRKDEGLLKGRKCRDSKGREKSESHPLRKEDERTVK